jgi:hypothetical protein
MKHTYRCQVAFSDRVWRSARHTTPQHRGQQHTLCPSLRGRRRSRSVSVRRVPRQANQRCMHDVVCNLCFPEGTRVQSRRWSCFHTHRRRTALPVLSYSSLEKTHRQADKTWRGAYNLSSRRPTEDAPGSELPRQWRQIALEICCVTSNRYACRQCRAVTVHASPQHGQCVDGVMGHAALACCAFRLSTPLPFRCWLMRVRLPFESVLFLR